MTVILLIPLRPIVEKIVEESSEFLPVVAPSLKLIQTAKKVMNDLNPISASTRTISLLLEICGGKSTKYVGLCSAWATTTALGFVTGNPALIAISMETATIILEDWHG